MSATIPIGKLKFTVFGKGYDDERGNSGPGTKETTILDWSTSYAEFDITGKYCWAVMNGNRLVKYETETWTEVDKGSVDGIWVGRPKNVVSNLGVSLLGDGYHVMFFDMTTNEIIKTVEISSYVTGAKYIVILDDNTVRLAMYNWGNANPHVYSINVDTETFNDVYFGNRTCAGFIDNNSVFCAYIRQWFYQRSTIHAYNVISGAEEWMSQEAEAGSFTANVVGFGIADGNIYLPIASWNGKGVIGVFDGSSAPDISTPTPIRVIGDVYEGFTIDGAGGVLFTTENEDACFRAGDGNIYMTDFNSIYKVVNSNGISYEPIAISDNMLLCRKGVREMEVFEF